ncbi:MAG: hypothetical protein KIT28_08925 [Rubrivivax sp.]|nr:hypothetical protein [Rubrivivax sp.]
MSKTLSAVAVDVIEAYGNTAINVISAYRAGTERVIDYVDTRFEAAVSAGGARLSDNLRSGLIDAEKRLSGYYTRGLELGVERAQNAVNFAVDLAHKGVDRMAANAERFDQATNSGALELFNRVAMPAASAMSEIVFRIEQGTGELAKKAAGEQAVVKAAARKARAVKKATAKTTAKTKEKAAVAKRKVVRKTRAVTREVAAAAA